MITLLVYLIVLGIVLALVFWLCDYLPVPAPLNRWIKIIAIVISALLLINIVLGVGGVDTGLRMR